MVTLQIPKTKYEALNKQAKDYRKLISKLFEFVVKDPVENVVADFRQTDLYSDAFLQDLEVGLKKSSYLKNGNFAVKKRSH